MPKYDSPPYPAFHPVTVEQAKENHDPSSKRAALSAEDRPTSPPSMYNPFFTGRSRTPGHNEGRTSPIDRQEIIRKIKTGDIRRSHSPVEEVVTISKSQSKSKSRSASRSPSPLQCFPPSEYQRDGASAQDWASPDRNALGLQISRPRSALHRGDFREEEESSSPWRLDGGQEQHDPSREWQAPVSTSPVVPWHHAFPANAHRQSMIEPSRRLESDLVLPARPRAVSHASLSSSFAYQPPTSPLVHQANAADIPDHEPHVRHPRRSSPDKRRHTYSPRLIHQSKSTYDYPSAPRSAVQSHVSLRRETTFPCQAHQPRRSIGSFNSLPQTPYLAARRPSITDASPLQHAPMVGSYEESILRGRMSTPASKPLNFVAQIGVLGKGDCKPSLKCPPHVSVPFPAVFYSYRSGLAVDPEPSPYVGMVDLENTLEKPPPRDTSRKRRRHHSPHDSRPNSHSRLGNDAHEAQLRKRRHQKAGRRSQSPKEPPGGSYRIPQTGQLQIVLKNPNKTAVKLFLVPYDLSDMEPGQKTFIRQRSYSAGPIIDMPITSRKNYGTDRPEASLSSTNDPKDRPILRYLIHLNFCCSSKNRFFLYQNIRVVFANRVPDGKEKLRSEIQMPEPRYSAYKPGRDSNAGLGSDLVQRRRSAVLPASAHAADPGYGGPLSASIGMELFGNNQLFVKSFDNTSYEFPAVQRLPTLESRPASRGMSDDTNIGDISQSPTSPLLTRIKRLASSEESRDNEGEMLKFSREPSRERVSSSGRGESLLSRRLKDLEMRGTEGNEGL